MSRPLSSVCWRNGVGSDPFLPRRRGGLDVVGSAMRVALRPNGLGIDDEWETGWEVGCVGGLGTGSDAAWRGLLPRLCGATSADVVDVPVVEVDAVDVVRRLMTDPDGRNVRMLVLGAGLSTTPRRGTGWVRYRSASRGRDPRNFQRTLN